MNRSGFQHEIAPTEIEVECAYECDDTIGESPMWCPLTARLFRVDVERRKLHIFTPRNGGHESFAFEEPITAVCPRKGGGLLITLAKQFAFFDPDSGKLERVGNPEPDAADNRLSDAKCDRQGRFWAGTMGQERSRAPVGSLYRFDPNRTTTKIKPEVCCSGGLGWSPDSRTFYFTESFRHAIFAFDYDLITGHLSNSRVFARLSPESGAFPDGLTVDAEGGVWSAQPVFGRVVRFSPDGTLDRIYELPVSRGTSVMFGGEALDTLYVTTARDSLTLAELEEEPLAGSLLSLKPGFRGLPEAPFAG
jgi:sugar lactone lactonase YvrE